MSASRFVLAATLLCLTGLLPFASTGSASTIHINNDGGESGLALVSQDGSGVGLHFQLDLFELEPIFIDGKSYQRVSMPEVFLPNDAGAPDLPGIGRFVAMPNGATARIEFVPVVFETYQNIDISPAPVLPREGDDGPLVYEANPEIYNRDAFYPENPVLLSEPGVMRGVDVVTVGVTPFQYNPVTRELIVYSEIDIRIDFIGGNGEFGEERLRSRFWEPILEAQLLNYASLPDFDGTALRGDRNGYEYLIITPDNPPFIAWADSLKNWRTLQGIETGIFTTTDIGGTDSNTIEAWLNNAYNTWDPAPAAFLFLADYPASGLRDSGITSPLFNDTIYPCISDNIYADVNGDHLPDMVHARITARDEADLEMMIQKMLSFERNPPTDAGFYDHPIFAGGWQTERWFILCSEIVLGHQEHVLGKSPVREYAIYDGTPGSSWSSSANTSLLVNYFGPNGLGYIPQTPEHLDDWGATAARLNNDINSGAYMLLHRDHGGETGWGEPSYGIGSLAGLSNDMLPFVFSMNCLTGKYNWSSECFTEAFHRMQHGALGLVAASEISYSFVNDCLVFGLIDGMWPGFMPDYGPYPPETPFSTELRPAFGMVNGKYFLQASNWPWNTSDKTVTYHLFHHHGDPFLRIYSEIPQELSVSHDEVCLIGTSTFQVQANFGSVIALTIDGEIVGRASGTGFPLNVPITPPDQPGELIVTVTSPNHFRYSQTVPIIPPSGPYLVYNDCTINDLGGDNDGQLDAGETAELFVQLHNVGIEATTGIVGTLSSTDPNIDILVSEQAFPDIDPDSTRTCVEPYVVVIDGETGNQHPISFELGMVSDDGSWDSNFSLIVQAPILASGIVLINDSAPGGNGDGGADPGEIVFIQLVAANDGHSDARDMTGILSCDHLDVSLTDAEGVSLRVPAQGEGVFGGFEVEILPSCPDQAMIPLNLSVTSSVGYSAELEYELAIGPWSDDAEADRGWAFSVPDDDASTGRWIRAEPIGTEYEGSTVQPGEDHTPDPASFCFVTANGSVGGTAGEADVDGGKTTLLSPVFDLSDAITASVGYWRWYTNNLGNNPGQDYWDVDVTADGETWVHLEHTMDSDNSWVYHEYLLDGVVPLSETVQIRFVADDTSPGSLVEAAVDDFVLIADREPVTGVATDVLRATYGIESVHPNPFNPRVSIRYRVGQETTAKLELYDVSGRKVRSLIDGPIEAGSHDIAFDGKDDRGQSVPSGIYFLRFDTPEVLEVRQITLLK